jgi:hypothetical protein
MGKMGAAMQRTGFSPFQSQPKIQTTGAQQQAIPPFGAALQKNTVSPFQGQAGMPPTGINPATQLPYDPGSGSVQQTPGGWGYLPVPQQAAEFTAPQGVLGGQQQPDITPSPFTAPEGSMVAPPGAQAPNYGQGTRIDPITGQPITDLSGLVSGGGNLVRDPLTEAGRLASDMATEGLRTGKFADVESARGTADRDSSRRRALALQRANEVALRAGAQPGTAQYQAILDRSMAEANEANLSQGNQVLGMQRQYIQDALDRAEGLESNAEGRRLDRKRELENWINSIENPVAKQAAQNAMAQALRDGKDPTEAIRSLFEPSGVLKEEYRNYSVTLPREELERKVNSLTTNPETGLPWKPGEKTAYVDKLWNAQIVAQGRPIIEGETEAQRAAKFNGVIERSRTGTLTPEDLATLKQSGKLQTYSEVVGLFTQQKTDEILNTNNGYIMLGGNVVKVQRRVPATDVVDKASRDYLAGESGVEMTINGKTYWFFEKGSKPHWLDPATGKVVDRPY